MRKVILRNGQEVLLRPIRPEDEEMEAEMAIVGEIEQDGVKHLIGVVRIVGDGWRETAEYAILVEDAWHGQGLGGILTDFIIEIGRAQGYHTIKASFLKTNGNMRRLFVRKGFKMMGSDEDSNLTELKLR